MLRFLRKHWWLPVFLLLALVGWMAFGAGMDAGFKAQRHIRPTASVGYPQFLRDLRHGLTKDGSLWVSGSTGDVYFDGKLGTATAQSWLVRDFGKEVTPAGLTAIRQARLPVHGNIAFGLTPAVPATSQLAWAEFFDTFGRMGMGLVYLLFAGVMLLYARQMLDGVVGSRMRVVDQRSNPPLRFSDVAGLSGPKLEVSEMVAYLRDPRALAALGGRAPRGVLLYGPPGNGKTLLAKAVAGEAGVAFLEQDAASFVQLYVGAGAMAVRRLFKEARKRAPCVVFIDEIDAVGTRRFGGGAGGHDERLQTLNALLAEMQGFQENSGVIVMAATNALEQLDPALTRPGRFDRKVHVPMPGREDRREILAYYLARLSRTEVDPEHLAARSQGFSAADLEHWVNESAIEAARQHDAVVRDYHFALSRDRILIGPRNYGVTLSPREREVTAWHEAGHAIVRLATGGRVDKVSILPRGQALGVTVSIPDEEDRLLATRESLHQELQVLMAGRAAEELSVGVVSGGASNDMERASFLARQGISRMGFGSFGPYVPEGRELTAEAEQEARRWVLAAHADAKAMLDRHREALRWLHDQLLVHEDVTLDPATMPEIRGVMALAENESFVYHKQLDAIRGDA